MAGAMIMPVVRGAIKVAQLAKGVRGTGITGAFDDSSSSDDSDSDSA